MGRAIGVALVIIGALLVYWGYHSGHALASEVSKTVTGSPTDQTRWYYISGIICIVIGAFLALFGVRRR